MSSGRVVGGRAKEEEAASRPLGPGRWNSRLVGVQTALSTDRGCHLQLGPSGSGAFSQEGTDGAAVESASVDQKPHVPGKVSSCAQLLP